MTTTANPTVAVPFWERIKGIPGFVVSIVGLISVTASAAIFVVGYFATREQLKTVDCVYDNYGNALSAQIEQIILYIDYTTKKSEWLERSSALDAAPNDHGLRLKVEEIARDMDATMRKIQDARGEFVVALDLKEDCLKNGAPL